MGNKKLIAGFTALLLAVVMAVIFGSVRSASATKPPVCVETVTVVDEEAWTETVEHPAETHEEVVPGKAAVWANWAPNHTQGPQDYVPIWPEDSRGTWIVHNQLPPGHEGPDGVYQQGAGNSPWFYREAGTPDTTVVVVDKEAWTETIEHPEVSHEETVQVDCPEEPEEPEEPPVTPEEPENPDTPDNPAEPKDPVITTETRNTPFKTVKISTHKSGAVTRDVTRYSRDTVEEGM